MNDDQLDLQVVLRFLDAQTPDVEGRGLHSTNPSIVESVRAMARGITDRKGIEELSKKILEDRDLLSLLASEIRQLDQPASNTTKNPA